uniref:Uncharacterized protein n=1 Tax=Pithovirus LCPAC404 TaxID=2506597 RepID=A0A481ZBR7_9VIRU|nr:MAG: hypothetical protein LCPAC404_00320 [Pithovirus LCPAC404]
MRKQVNFIYAKAASEGVACDITFEGLKNVYFKQDGLCAKTGMKMTFN